MQLSTNGPASEATRPLRVIIIGAGFSGTLVAVHLLRQSRPVQVDLVDERLPGRGRVFNYLPEHSASAPLRLMPASLLRAGCMVRTSRICLRPRPVRLDHVKSFVTTSRRLYASASMVYLQTYSWETERLFAEKVVLALGNPASRNFTKCLPGYFSSPWHPDAIARLDSEEKVLLVGSGLTAVDAFLALVAQGHVGQIHMVSSAANFRSPMSLPSVAAFLYLVTPQTNSPWPSPTGPF
jgi:uncharacterized NAD(P)/FAD-binding protein YdhS